MTCDLDIFVGIWDTSGRLWATPEAEPVDFRAEDRYEWLAGGHFLLHHVEADMAGTEVLALEIARPDGDEWILDSYDNTGGFAVSRARLTGRDWLITGESERFAGTFTPDLTRIVGRWERLDQGEWVRWMEVTLTKQSR
jgi:hypothetical protein